METLNAMFGVGNQAQELTVSQVFLRALLIFFVSLVIVRVADKRFFARKSAYDVLRGFILGSLHSALELWGNCDCTSNRVGDSCHSQLARRSRCPLS